MCLLGIWPPLGPPPPQYSKPWPPQHSKPSYAYGLCRLFDILFTVSPAAKTHTSMHTVYVCPSTAHDTCDYDTKNSVILCLEMYLCLHIWENHIQPKKGKSRFLGKNIAVFGILTISQRDCFTYENKRRVVKQSSLTWEFYLPIGVEGNKLLYVGKNDEQGVIITAFPTKRI